MPTFAEAEAALKARGYTDANVEEKLAQDILLAAFARSGHRAQLAIKGGVVMAALSGDIRRTTLDLDVDFVHRSIDDDSIRALVRDLDGGVEGVSVSLVGDIVELRQQDYRGKRVFLSLQDEAGDTIQAKLDIGVHALAGVEQVEMAFDVGTAAAGPAVLFANSPEQVFVEKLRSLLRLGRRRLACCAVPGRSSTWSKSASRRVTKSPLAVAGSARDFRGENYVVGDSSNAVSVNFVMN